jgi:nickel-type superoxide dismutase maturation protease
MVHRRVVPGIVHLLLWLAGRRRRFRVAGHSMYPTFGPGDQLLVDPRAYRKCGPKAGDLVVSRHPYRSDVRLVKRVVGIPDRGRCLLAGDNPEESTDSRLFGSVPDSLLVGRVVFRFPARSLIQWFPRGRWRKLRTLAGPGGS